MGLDQGQVTDSGFSTPIPPICPSNVAVRHRLIPSIHSSPRFPTHNLFAAELTFRGVSVFPCLPPEFFHASQTHYVFLPFFRRRGSDPEGQRPHPCSQSSIHPQSLPIRFSNLRSWCAAHGLASLPSAPQTIALYIASCVVARLAPATIARRMASISKAHQAAGFETSPASTKHFVVGEVLKGARRTLGVAQKCKDPLLLNDLPPPCRMPEESTRPARSRTYSDRFRRSVSPLRTLCDDRS